MLVVMIGWVFFSQTDFGALGHYLGTMFGIGASGFIDKTALYYLKTGFILLLISILCAVLLLTSTLSVWSDADLLLQ